MTMLDFIVYFSLVVFTLKGGSLLTIKNVKIGSFRKKQAKSRGKK